MRDGSDAEIYDIVIHYCIINIIGYITKIIRTSWGASLVKTTVKTNRHGSAYANCDVVRSP